MMKPAKESPLHLIWFSLRTAAVYLAMQAIVVMHEFALSTAAWAQGYTPTPFTVIWGNPLTLQGWDEGVPYDQLFPSAKPPSRERHSL